MTVLREIFLQRLCNKHYYTFVFKGKRDIEIQLSDKCLCFLRLKISNTICSTYKPISICTIQLITFEEKQFMFEELNGMVWLECPRSSRILVNLPLSVCELIPDSEKPRVRYWRLILRCVTFKSPFSEERKKMIYIRRIEWGTIRMERPRSWIQGFLSILRWAFTN